VVYQIVQAESQAIFAIFEELRGSPFTAVGVTDQVAGEILIDFDNAAAQLGVIQVNARTLKTDSSLRDRAISNQILNTSRYEFITFEPTAISGLPSSISPGETITFQITGNLTIREITQEVTFEMQVTLVDRNRLEGQGQATVLRSDYNLIIPSVPSVANVADNVLLEIKFTATAAP
jgi:polyisoprenoid-binding protein YceI